MTRSCPRCGKTSPGDTARFCDDCGAPVVKGDCRGDPLCGRILGGRFRVVSKVGEGGMGRVYLAEDLFSHREAALKVLNPTFASNTKVRTRFRMEAESLFNLSHPHIVEFLGYLEGDAGMPCLFMEFIRGRTVRQTIDDEGPMPAEKLVTVSSQVLAGLHYLHTLPVPMIHRDVKPDNISYVPGGSVKLIDFGIAKAPGKIGLTMAGSAIGTYEYMAPEQVEGSHDLTPACDQYSMGVTMYYMACGRVPFQQTTDTGWEVLKAHKYEEPPAPKGWAPNLPDFINIGILRALAKSPLERFPSSFHFQRYLETAGAEGAA